MGNLKISWAIYKVALLAFVVAFGIFWFLLRVGALDSEPATGKLPISQVVCGLALLMCFFGFFLYAKVKGVEDCHEAFQPARLLPYVTFLVVVPSLLYPYYLLQIVDTIESSRAEYRPVLESKLEQMKKDALDKSVTIEQRREKADRYHIETNEKIHFLDETGERRFLEPTDASKTYDQEFQDVQNTVKALYKFWLLSGLASFLFAVTATFLFFRYR